MKLVSRTGLVAAATAVTVTATGLVAPAANAETTGTEGVVATAGTGVRAADSNGGSSKSESTANGGNSSTSDNALTEMWNKGPEGKVESFATVIGGMLGVVAVLALISRGLTELTKAIGK